MGIGSSKTTSLNLRKLRIGVSSSGQSDPPWPLRSEVRSLSPALCWVFPQHVMHALPANVKPYINVSWLMIWCFSIQNEVFIKLMKNISNLNSFHICIEAPQISFYKKIMIQITSLSLFFGIKKTYKKLENRKDKTYKSIRV